MSAAPKKESDLSASRVRELLSYDSAAGIFTWKVRLSNRVTVGAAAGTRRTHSGYVQISIDGVLFKAHRLAWLHVTGEWPSDLLDHINGDRADNRFSNLREVSSRGNQQNQRKAKGNTASGALGVYEDEGRSKRWRAAINVDGEQRFLGRFYTKDEASAAYIEAKRKHHSTCTI